MRHPREFKFKGSGEIFQELKGMNTFLGSLANKYTCSQSGRTV